jgi:hypothetical protein
VTTRRGFLGALLALPFAAKVAEAQTETIGWYPERIRVPATGEVMTCTWSEGASTLVRRGDVLHFEGAYLTNEA